MINSLLRFLNEPFPNLYSIRESFLITLGVGAFIAGFLYFFKPFGAENLGDRLLWISLGFGLVTIICIVSYDWIINTLIGLETDVPSWVFWKWLLYCFGLIGWIALGNVVFVDLTTPGTQFSLKNWVVYALPQTMAIGLFPVVFSGLLIQLRQLKKNQQHAESIELNITSKSAALLSFPISAKEQVLEVSTDDFFYAKAMQNYVELVYRDGQSVERHLLRSTFAGIYDLIQAKSGFILQCHRSYLVNLAQVEKIEGNAQGLKLSLIDVADESIPVSRKYIQSVKQVLLQG